MCFACVCVHICASVCVTQANALRPAVLFANNED
jgi:hypothetical protein